MWIDLIELSLDTLGGYHSDPALRKWPCGSCWENEGQYLYRTVREMKPDVIVEVGRSAGCSASHLALGCKHNGKGRVYSIDVASGTGQQIPADLLSWIELVNTDALKYEWPKELPIDLLLEDGEHTWGFTENILRRYPARRVIVHDYKHWDCQKTVAAECRKILGEPHEVFFEPPSDCGYGIWRFD